MPLLSGHTDAFANGFVLPSCAALKQLGSRRAALVAMVQPADLSELDDLARRRWFDTVRVIRLFEPSRGFDGTADVRRAPRVGDTDAIVLVYEPDEAFAVENVDENGLTVRLADFRAEELELLPR